MISIKALTAAVLISFIPPSITEKEPNNRFSIANPIGSTVEVGNEIKAHGILRTKTDKDFFLVKVIFPTKVKIILVTDATLKPTQQVKDPGPTFKPRLTIYDHKYKVLLDEVGETGNLFIPKFKVPDVDYIYIEVSYGGFTLKQGDKKYWLSLTDSLI